VPELQYALTRSFSLVSKYLSVAPSSRSFFHFQPTSTAGTGLKTAEKGEKQKMDSQHKINSLL
jgi:hypothetical protein